ncbi:TlpA family protein disulfide reductase [Nocardioides sp. MAHUQ-72]|uniref:TlpA family protein disulfide reductase n=1 Tax=unclassified Nocardioides TaxID=2615069 RepID=UPI0036090F71
MRPSLVAALAAAVLVLSACGTDSVPAPGPAKIDVDTQQLRQAKKDAGVEPCRPADAAPVDGGLPDVTLPCFGGGDDVTLSSLRGPLVVNLWASWCGPCRQEMPVLQQFHEQYGDRVGVLGIDFQDPQAQGAMDLVGKSGVTYPLLADPQGELQGAAPFPARMGLPLFAFVDESGHVELAAGGVDSVDELVDLVDEHLGVQL